MNVSQQQLFPPNSSVVIVPYLINGKQVGNANLQADGMMYPYSLRQGLNLPNFKCKTGVANPDNMCVCPQSQNTPPWNSFNPEFRKTYLGDILFASQLEHN